MLIRKSIYGKKHEALKEEGLIFEYDEKSKIEEDIHFKTNFNKSTGLDLKEIKALGSIRIDALILLSEIKSLCDEQGIEHDFKVMHKVNVGDKKDAVVPCMLTLKEDNYPVYFIYDDFHETQFQKIRHRLVDNGFKNPIYFSALKYSSVD